jgi:hypothetical protein
MILCIITTGDTEKSLKTMYDFLLRIYILIALVLNDILFSNCFC